MFNLHTGFGLVVMQGVCGGNCVGGWRTFKWAKYVKVGPKILVGFIDMWKRRKFLEGNVLNGLFFMVQWIIVLWVEDHDSRWRK